MKRKMQKMYKKEQRKESRKERKSPKKHSAATETPPGADSTISPVAGWTSYTEDCNPKELMKVGQDLLIEFKKQQDDANEVSETTHQIEKRNSKKKELREDGSVKGSFSHFNIIQF